MLMAEVIRRKRDGAELDPATIREVISGIVSGEVPDYQAAALLMAVFFRGLTDAELVAWTQAMLHSGDVFDLSRLPGRKVDKHSTGGVGDKISIPLAPLVAACGVKVPMISGRGLGHTGGTLDKLESIPGFRTDLSPARFIEGVATIGTCMIGQTESIVPADKRMYALRDVTPGLPGLLHERRGGCAHAVRAVAPGPAVPPPGRTWPHTSHPHPTSDTLRGAHRRVPRSRQPLLPCLSGLARHAQSPFRPGWITRPPADRAS